MAGYTPNYGAGAPEGAEPTHPSYLDYLSSTFVHHFNGLPARLNAGGEDEERPRPLDSERYFDDYDQNQSNTCARLAVDFYNQQEGNSTISLDSAKDSHKFFSEGTAYFHVNFKASFVRGGRQQQGTFFAEVKGGGVPESVTMVVQFHNKEEGMTRDNCLYCTGLSHPEQGGFVGHTTASSGDDDEGIESGGSEEWLLTSRKPGVRVYRPSRCGLWRVQGI